MAVLAPFAAETPDRGAVLTRATLRAADELGLTGHELAQVLGVSDPTVSRMKKGAYQLEDGSKSFEMAALLVRLFRSLDAIAAGETEVARAWLRAENTALHGVPAAMIRKVTGLTDVIRYLDARRAPL